MMSKWKKGRKLGIIVALIFSIAIGMGICFYSSKKASQENILPPVIKEIISLNENIKTTTIDLYNASGKLDSLGMVQSRKTDIESTIKVINTLRKLLEDNQLAIDNLINFIEDHSEYVHRKNLSWVFGIKEFYTNHHVIQNQKSFGNYLAAFEALLQYTYSNFQNIMEFKSQKHMKSYDVYYMQYRKAADSYNQFNKKRVKFQAAFAEEHQEVKPFLPGFHHLEPFKFWDKFSF